MATENPPFLNQISEQKKTLTNIEKNVKKYLKMEKNNIDKVLEAGNILSAIEKRLVKINSLEISANFQNVIFCNLPNSDNQK